MKELLSQLGEIPGISGGMIITLDGILVLSALGDDHCEDSIAALSSSLVLSLKRGLTPFGCDQLPTEVTVHADNGNLVFVNLGNAYLVVVTQPRLRLNADLVEIRGVARRLRQRTAMLHS